MALPTVTLTGTYIEPDGTPIAGWIDFCPPSVLTFSDEPTFVACCSRAHLDENGSFTIDLVATDAPGSNIEDDEWFYQVHEYLQCENGERTYYIPLLAASSPIDLAQIAPTTEPPTLNYLRLPGPEGPPAPDGAVARSGDTMTGFLTLHANPNLNLHAATRQYVDGAQAAAETASVSLTGDTMTGPLSFSTSGVDVDVQQAFGASLSTGVISGGRISASATANALDIADLRGYIVDTHTDPLNPTATLVEVGAQTVPLDAGSLARSVSWFLMDASGTVSQQADRPTPEQLRTRLVLGVIVYDPATETIFVALSAANDPTQLANNWADSMDALGPYKTQSSALRLSANGANLSLDLSAGEIFSRGFQRYSTMTGDLTQSPNRLQVAARTAFTTRRVTRNFAGSEPQVTTIDPTQWDDNGTLTAVGGGSGQATVQRVFMAANGLVGNDTVVQYGQAVFDTLEDAVAGYIAGTFEIATGVEDNAILLGHIAVIRTATDLSDPVQARFIHASRFPNV